MSCLQPISSFLESESGSYSPTGTLFASLGFGIGLNQAALSGNMTAQIKNPTFLWSREGRGSQLPGNPGSGLWTKDELVSTLTPPPTPLVGTNWGSKDK
ncbi:unnamed protein product [Protopolystoma xenopodis]|uniref:Uncharacterized protein n=1 Tax=Protopolystoma xenopodis TaxID=117903 RepID=A0A3S5A110_9PLAT|nr:unnamed protein product [Protopolystoma xenopodis]